MTANDPFLRAAVQHHIHTARGQTASEMDVLRGLCTENGAVNVHTLRDAATVQWDCDFTSIKTDTTQFRRGNMPYKRPLGSKRYALNARGVYANDAWLGAAGNRTQSSDGEWPVAYHGTTNPCAADIVKSGGFDLTKCKRIAFGPGIYSTPDPATALAYSTPFKYGAKSYKLIVQCRVDLSRTKIVTKAQHGARGCDDYWIVQVEDAIRTYGICIYPV